MEIQKIIASFINGLDSKSLNMVVTQVSEYLGIDFENISPSADENDIIPRLKGKIMSLLLNTEGRDNFLYNLRVVLFLDYILSVTSVDAPSLDEKMIKYQEIRAQADFRSANDRWNELRQTDLSNAKIREFEATFLEASKK